jgi:hypothetical protein
MTRVDDRLTALESRLGAIETQSRVIIAVAAVFGISGAFGWSLLQGANARIRQLTAQIETVANSTKLIDRDVGIARSAIDSARNSAVAAVEKSAIAAVEQAAPRMLGTLSTRVSMLEADVSGPVNAWFPPEGASRPGGDKLPGHYDKSTVECPRGTAVRAARLITVSGGQLALQVGCSR